MFLVSERTLQATTLEFEQFAELDALRVATASRHECINGLLHPFAKKHAHQLNIFMHRAVAAWQQQADNIYPPYRLRFPADRHGDLTRTLSWFAEPRPEDGFQPLAHTPRLICGAAAQALRASAIVEPLINLPQA